MAPQPVSRHCEERSSLASANALPDEEIQSSLTNKEACIASSLRFSKPRNVLLAVTIIVGVSDAAYAQSLPDTETGRYTLSPVTDGVVRLDTRTGAVSTCTNKGAGWACYAIPDERAAFDTEIGRLQAENDTLRTQLAQREQGVGGKTDDSLPKQDPLLPRIPKTADGERKLEIPLPSDRDIDRVMGFVESAWRRLVDMAARIQKDTSGKI